MNCKNRHLIYCACIQRALFIRKYECTNTIYTNKGLILLQMENVKSPYIPIYKNFIEKNSFEKPRRYTFVNSRPR